MKIQIKFIIILLTSVVMVLASSCRSEFNEEIYSEQDQTLEVNSKIADLIKRTTMSDGSIDNILDGSSCFNVQLPVIVNVNGIELTIDSLSSLELIEEILSQTDINIGALNFIFPITLISVDFSGIIIENETQLKEVIENCEENDDDDDDIIKCIDFLYPFSVSVFNRASELLETITFNNDNKLYRFIENLDVDDVVNINFPITLTLSDSAQIVINNLEDIESTIEESIGDCDDNNDDDNDDTISLDLFTQVITSKPLEVQKFKENQSNETKNYKGYVFNFSEDGTVQVTLENNNGEDNITNGTWSVNATADGGLNTILDFGTEDPLNKLNKEWNVKKIKEDRIMLDNKDDEGVSKDELFFKKV